MIHTFLGLFGIPLLILFLILSERSCGRTPIEPRTSWAGVDMPGVEIGELRGYSSEITSPGGSVDFETIYQR
jgi:hypothetical protein